MNRILLKSIEFLIERLDNSRFARDLYARLTGRYVDVSPDTYRNRDWVRLDKVYTHCRRELYRQIGWGQGPAKVHYNVQRILDNFSKFTDITGKTYCDLGCGEFSPYGQSVLFYLNGCSSTLALDISDKDSARAAEAMFDLLVMCMIEGPERWGLTPWGREHLIARIKAFDLRKLMDGDLAGGLNGVPLRHYAFDIHAPLPAEIVGSSDLLSSIAVLEHFAVLDVAVKNMFDLMSPGAISYHFIDLSDHRRYDFPWLYHEWSFLLEGDDWSHPLVNRVRVGEMRSILEDTGFEILQWDTESADTPPHVMKQLAGRFAHMPKEQIDTLRVHCVLKKPERL